MIMVSTDKNKKHSNRMLRWLILASFFIHIPVFLHMNGLLSTKVLDYIDLTVQKVKESSSRAIPRPPSLFKNKGKPGRQKASRLTPVPVPENNKMFKENVLPVKSDIAAGSIGTLPGGSNLTAGSGFGHSFGEGTVDGGSGSKDDYLEMVRLKVKRNNRFPEEAQKKQRGGVVSVSFVINLDGTIRDLMLIKPSPFDELNKQALQAVRDSSPFKKPPAYIFKEDIPLIINVYFDLI